ncbi:MAG: zinc-ribbon domain-containing protein, partial [Nitrospinaceae bacterium]
MKIICPDCQAAYEVRLPETSQKDVKVKCARCKSKFLVQQTSRDAALPEKMVGSPGPNIKSLGRDKSFDDFIPDRDEGSGDLAQSRQDSPFDTEENLDDYLDQLFDEKIEDSPPASPAPQPDSPELELAQDNLPSDDFLEDLFDEIIQKDLGKQTKDNPSEEDLSLPSTVSEEINGDNLDDFFDEIIREEFNEPSGETAGKNREPGTTSTAVEDSLQDAGPASPKKEIDPPKPPVPPAKETAQTEEAAGESAIVENQGENGSDALTEGNPGETSLSPESENSPAADTPPAHPEAGDATHGEEAASAEMDPATPDSHVSEKGMDESGGPVSQTPTPPLEKDPEPPQVPEEEKPSTAETSGDKEPANILAKAGDTQDSADPKEAPAEGKSGEKSDDDL